MINKIAIIIILLISLRFIGISQNNNKGSVKFQQPVFMEEPLGSILPKGWLKDQLETMRDGSTGHLDEVYNKLKNDNGWLGGKGDGWEETPYWLDGAVPLAYLLNDATLKNKVLKYINWTLDHQRPSGYFGPITKAEREEHKIISNSNPQDGEDWWPKMVMLKVLQQYYSASKDVRVIPFMKKFFEYQLQTLNKAPLGKWSEWAQSRGTENTLIIQWLYNINHDPSLLKLAALITKQMYPWSALFGGRDWVINAAAHQNEQDWMLRHGVNVAMALKDPVINYQRSGDIKYLNDLKKGFNDLMILHGLPMGTFSADEDLHGNLPTQGTELCAVVEEMFSLEQIISITGDIHYMDALERITFNALPAQTTDDYNNKQYFQIANQVEIARGVFDFSLPFGREMNNVLGMRSGYTCCLANMHQGWTKYANHLWYKTANNGIAALVYGPSTFTGALGDKNNMVTINENTSYPFSDEISFELSMKSNTSFPFKLRIPSWCTNATILLNNKKIKMARGGSIVTLTETWKNNDQITLQLPMNTTTSNWGRNSRAIERGPLVYALKIKERWEKGNEPKEGDYFSVFPESNWNYGLVEDIIKDPVKNLQLNLMPQSKGKFYWNQDHTPVQLNALGRQIPNWQLSDGVANQPVTDREGMYKGKVSDSLSHLILIPYGFTKLRVVAFPVVPN